VKAIDAGFKTIMIEKPGATSSSELMRLKRHAERKEATVLVNYQRQMDPLLAKVLS